MAKELKEHMDNVEYKAHIANKYIQKWEGIAGGAMSDLKLEILVLRIRLAQSEEKIKELQETNKNLKRDLDNCRNRTTALLNSCSSITFAQHSRLAIQLQQQIEDEKNKSKTQNAELELLRAKTQQQETTISNQQETFQHKYSDLKRESSNIRERCVSLQNDLDAKKDEFDRQKSKNTHLRKQCEDYDDKLQHITEQCNKYELELKNAMKQQQKYKQQRDDAVKLSAMYQKERDDAEDKALRYQRELRLHREGAAFGFDHDCSFDDNRPIMSPPEDAYRLGGDLDMWSFSDDTTELYSDDLADSAAPMDSRAENNSEASLPVATHKFHATTTRRFQPSPCGDQTNSSPISSASWHQWGGQLEQRENGRDSPSNSRLYPTDRSYLRLIHGPASAPHSYMDSSRMARSPGPSSGY